MAWLYQPLLPASAEIESAPPVTAINPAYWVGGAGTWDATNPANWAATSGGPGGAGYPDSNSTVYFDSNSGAGDVNIDGGVCNDLIVQTGASAVVLKPYTPSVLAGLTIHGSLTISSTNVQITGVNGGAIIFASTASETITTSGVPLNCDVDFKGVGGTWTLQDNLTVGIYTYLTNGTLNLNNQTLTTAYFNSNNSNTRTLAFGTGGITVTGETTDDIWNTGTATNLTVTGTPVVTTTGGGATTKTILTGSPTEANSISFVINNTAGTVSFPSTPTVGSVRNLTIANNSITLTVSLLIYIYGNLNIQGTNPTLTAGTQVWAFSATSGTKTITTNGKTLDFDLAFSNAGATYQLQDNLTVGSTRTTTLGAGTLDLNGKTLSAGASFAIGTGTKNLTFNGGTLLCPASSSTAFNNANPTNFTTTAGTGVGKISMSGGSLKRFVGGDSTYNCTLENAGSGTLLITGSNTFNDITNSVSPASFVFTAGTTTTVNNFSVSGTAGNPVTIYSSTGGSAFTLSKSSGTVNVNYCYIIDSTATGGATWQAYTTNGNLDAGGNTGWIFIAPNVFITIDNNVVLGAGILISF